MHNRTKQCSQGRRDDQVALSTDSHRQKSLVPTFNHLAFSDLELKRLAQLAEVGPARAVEYFPEAQALLVQLPSVVYLDCVASLWGRTVTYSNV